MIKFTVIIAFVSLIAVVKSQTCLRPTLMTGFKIADYGKGTWFTIAGKATMNTPLTAACSRGDSSNNGSFVIVDAKSTVNGVTSSILVVAKAVGTNGVFSWYIPTYNVGLMTVKDLSFTYYVLYYDANIACIYITGTIQKVMSMNVVMIQARTKTIDSATYNRALTYFRRCNLGASAWVRIDQVTGCP